MWFFALAEHDDGGGRGGATGGSIRRQVKGECEAALRLRDGRGADVTRDVGIAEAACHAW